jgi:hypothetical protein
VGGGALLVLQVVPLWAVFVQMLGHSQGHHQPQPAQSVPAWLLSLPQHDPRCATCNGKGVFYNHDGIAQTN